VPPTLATPKAHGAWVHIAYYTPGGIAWTPVTLTDDADVQVSPDGVTGWTDTDNFTAGSLSPSDPNIYAVGYYRFVRTSDSALSNVIFIPRQS